jgi:hypothetical protein
LNRVESRIRRFDSWLRWLDFWLNRTAGGLLAGRGISRHTPTAVTLPALLTIMIVNGPSVRPTVRLVVAVAAGAIAWFGFAKALAWSERRGWSIARDLVGQIVLLAAIGSVVWFYAGPDSRERGVFVYQHVFIPVTGLFGAALIAGALMAAGLFRSTLGRKDIPKRLPLVELFVRRPRQPPITLGMLTVAAIGAVTSSPGRVLFLPSLLTLLVIRPWVWSAFVGGLLVNLVLLAFANLDPRFSASWNVVHRWWFRGWSAAVSVAVIVLGSLRFLDVQYVATVFDGARSWTIGGYLYGAYVLTWWFDYWNSTLVAIRFLDLLGGRGGAADARIEYPVDPGIDLTSVPAAGRVIQVHGGGRLLVLNDTRRPPLFHSYEPAEMADALVAGTHARDPVRGSLGWARWRLDVHFLLSSLLLVTLLGGSAFLLSRRPQQALISSSASRGTAEKLRLADTVFPLSACTPGGTVVAVAASGGGTRAALYTTVALERLRRYGRLGDVRLVSGVSGGGAALAYYVANRDALIAASPDEEGDAGAWPRFFTAMQRPYIEDVIDGSGEWRITTQQRLGQLLAESFERHWNASTTVRGVGEGVGIMLNSAIAGRFKGDPASSKSLADQEAESRDGKSDVAGGRVVYTNLDVEDQLGSPALFDTRRQLPTTDAQLPIFVINGPEVSLGRAAAANANFPPVFSNAAVDRLPDLRLWITDGGAVDNRGTETLLMAIRGALRGRAETCKVLPALHILEVEASAYSDGYSQDRGLGSKMAAGSAFASGLDSELLADIRELYRSAQQDPDTFVQFHFLPMPTVLRSSGSFGTHWMMQEHIEVKEEAGCGWFEGLFHGTGEKCRKTRAVTGEEMVVILRNLANDALPGKPSENARAVHALAWKDGSRATWDKLKLALRPQPIQ